MRNYRSIPLWRNIPRKKWINWRWQLKNAVDSLSTLEKVINLSEKEKKGIVKVMSYLKMKISPHIISMMDPDDPNDSLRKQFIPSIEETQSMKSKALFEDVNADDRYSPVVGLVHRYPTKALFFPSNYCGSFCRYCFRRRFVKEQEKNATRKEIGRAAKYVRKHHKIEEVILSGGDPLVLGDLALNNMLSAFVSIPHVKVMRIHTRIPVTVPYRITTQFIKMITKYKPIYIIIHIDSVREISKPMRQAVNLLVDNGIPCLASCPLLKDINDSEQALRDLWTELVKMRIKPYYLFHSDPVQGLRHFLVSIEKGKRIMKNLYDRMSGLGMPHYCLNIPDGGGHVLIGNNDIRKVAKRRYVITNFEGKRIPFYDFAQD